MGVFKKVFKKVSLKRFTFPSLAGVTVSRYLLFGWCGIQTKKP
jgi:hypothetical protein